MIIEENLAPFLIEATEEQARDRIAACLDRMLPKMAAQMLDHLPALELSASPAEDGARPSLLPPVFSPQLLFLSTGQTGTCFRLPDPGHPRIFCSRPDFPELVFQESLTFRRQKISLAPGAQDTPLKELHALPADPAQALRILCLLSDRAGNAAGRHTVTLQLNRQRAITGFALDQMPPVSLPVEKETTLAGQMDALLRLLPEEVQAVANVDPMQISILRSLDPIELEIVHFVAEKDRYPKHILNTSVSTSPSPGWPQKALWPI